MIGDHGSKCVSECPLEDKATRATENGKTKDKTLPMLVDKSTVSISELRDTGEVYILNDRAYNSAVLFNRGADFVTRVASMSAPADRVDAMLPHLRAYDPDVFRPWPSGFFENGEKEMIVGNDTQGGIPIRHVRDLLESWSTLREEEKNRFAMERNQ